MLGTFSDAIFSFDTSDYIMLNNALMGRGSRLFDQPRGRLYVAYEVWFSPTRWIQILYGFHSFLGFVQIPCLQILQF